MTIDNTPGRRLRPNARRRRGTHVPRSTVRRELPAASFESEAPTVFTSGGVALLEREPDTATPAVAVAPVEPRIEHPILRLSATAPSDALSVTGILVEELWNLSPDTDITDWTPGELDDALVRTGVQTRKLMAVSLLAVALLVLAWRVLTWDGARLAESLDALETASTQVAADVESMRPIVSDLADGFVSDPLLASSGLARLDDGARRLFTVAGDMPTDESVTAIRQDAVDQASGALGLGTIVSESVAYASAVELITRPVELPAETDIEGLATVTAEVTGWVADFTDGASSLPSNELTDTHRRGLTDLAASLPDWQAAYLDALRGRDPARAAAHVEQLATQVEFVRSSWTTTAASIAGWATEQIDRLAVPLVVNR